MKILLLTLSARLSDGSESIMEVRTDPYEETLRDSDFKELKVQAIEKAEVHAGFSKKVQALFVINSLELEV